MAAPQRNLWYWAWLVQMTVPKGSRPNASSGTQVWRNLVLIQARTGAEALRKAEAIGRSSAGDADGTLLLEGRPARSVFLGIADAGLVDYQLGDGVEVMFQLGEESERVARRLARPRPALLARLMHETRQLHASRTTPIPREAAVRVRNGVR
jgi:hypothetical protein